MVRMYLVASNKICTTLNSGLSLCSADNIHYSDIVTQSTSQLYLQESQTFCVVCRTPFDSELCVHKAVMAWGLAQ